VLKSAAASGESTAAAELRLALGAHRSRAPIILELLELAAAKAAFPKSAGPFARGALPECRTAFGCAGKVLL
jgi:hypothetical protein